METWLHIRLCVFKYNVADHVIKFKNTFEQNFEKSRITRGNKLVNYAANSKLLPNLNFLTCSLNWLNYCFIH